MKKNLILSIITFLAIVLSFNVQAKNSDDETENKISDINIQAKASLKAVPDIFTATVEFSNEDLSSEYAQQEVNSQVSEAIKIIKKSKNTKYNVKSFSIYKKYKSKRFTASQSIFLESTNIKELENVVTKLQRNQGKVTGTRSIIKDKSSQKYFEQLFTEAYKKATDKAKFITKTVNGKDYKIKTVNYYINDRNPGIYAKNAMFSEATANNKINMDANKNTIEIVLNMSIAILTK